LQLWLQLRLVRQDPQSCDIVKKPRFHKGFERCRTTMNVTLAGRQCGGQGFESSQLPSTKGPYLLTCGPVADRVDSR